MEVAAGQGGRHEGHQGASGDDEMSALNRGGGCTAIGSTKGVKLSSQVGGHCLNTSFNNYYYTKSRHKETLYILRN